MTRGDYSLKIVNIHEVRTHLSRIIEAVANNHEIVIIAKAGKPMARLIPIGPERPERRFGILEGKIWIAEDFDGPLPDDLLKTFEGDA
jgi:prevent-host-death family protein